MDEVLNDVDAAFAGVPPPARWDRGTCACAECLEHVRTLETYRIGELPVSAFGSAAWDPLTVANDDAFRYFLPRLIRLATAHPRFLEQMLFHFTVPGRLDGITRRQAIAVRQALLALVDANADLLEPPLSYRMDEALRRLESQA